MSQPQIHPTACVDPGAEIGENTKIWHFCHVGGTAHIGKNCSLGQNVFVAGGAKVGDGSRIQNNVAIYEGVELKENVFCGPGVIFTNVLRPPGGLSGGRAIPPHGGGKRRHPGGRDRFAQRYPRRAGGDDGRRQYYHPQCARSCPDGRVTGQIKRVCMRLWGKTGRRYGVPGLWKKVPADGREKCRTGVRQNKGGLIDGTKTNSTL